MTDTICAIATPYGSGAISIIRISGPEAIGIVNSVFCGTDLTKKASHTISYGHIQKDNNVLDEVMISIMRAPKSFTMEDCVEINCHGGVYVTNQVLQLLLSKGIRLAEPGEFSKRAFLNGRIDLVQAEAIMDMIGAKNKMALDIANNGLSKKISQMIQNLKDKITDIIVHIDVNIDYPEYVDEIQMTNELIRPQILDLIEQIKVILSKSQNGKLIREGIKTAIIGKPNVGKSTLLNALLEEDKAIVSDIPGTTRDIIEGYVNIGGITLNLVDTAGIRQTKDVIEQIGVNRSKDALEKAELLLVVLDSSQELTQEDKDILEMTKNKKRVIINNKSDLMQNQYPKGVLLSAKEEIGIDALEQEILRILNLMEFNQFDVNYLSNIRHIDLMSKAYEALKECLFSIDSNLEIDMVEIDLRNAFNNLGEIIGENGTEFLVDTLFSRFCLGK